MSRQYNVTAKPFQPDAVVPATKMNSSANEKQTSFDGNRNGKRSQDNLKSHNQNRNRRRASGYKREPAVASGGANSRNNDSALPEHDIFNNSTVNKRGEISLSHLLNYDSPRRAQQSARGPPPRRNNGQSKNHYSNVVHDKDSYINTTCRFVLDPRGDYRQLLVDPDIPVPMENVMRIVMQASSCPICLEDVPEAPRMLECGHVMCYPCLFRFMDSENIVVPGQVKPKKYKECPLCFERVRMDRIKPVTFTPTNELFDVPKENNEIILRLMFRPSESLLALPKDIQGLQKQHFIELPDTSSSEICKFARLIRGTKEYALSEYDREIRELEESKDSNVNMYGDSGNYFDDAISMIGEVKRLFDYSSVSKIIKKPDRSSSGSFRLHGDVPVQVSHVSTDFSNLSLDDNDNNGARHGDKLATLYDDSNAYFFYQAGFDTVTKFFLAPMDTKILKEAYGAYSAFPETLLLTVENVLHGKYITPDLRKRMKHLAHLPIHTPIGFLECDWNGIVSEEILQKFSKELHARRKRKKDKERKEEREKRKFQREEEENFRRELSLEADYQTAGLISRTNVSNNNHSSINIQGMDPAILGISQHESQSSENVPNTPPQDGSFSFAQVASGNNQSVLSDKEYSRLMKEAKPKRKGGKKLVLLSNDVGRAGRS